MSVKYIVLQNLELTVHEHVKLCKLATGLHFTEQRLIQLLMNEFIFHAELTRKGKPKHLSH